jgi:hypothetical protein
VRSQVKVLLPAAALLASFFAAAGASAADPCPNATFRTGASANLPECRAYEMVSPLDKNGGDILRDSTPYSVSRAAAAGDRVVFTSRAAFAGVKGAPPYPEYYAARGAEGWSTRGISPRQDPFATPLAVQSYRYLSEDLGFGAVATVAGLTPDAPEESWNFYLEEFTDPLGYRLLSRPMVPLAPVDPAQDGLPRFVGASADASKVVFESTRALTADAPPENIAGLQTLPYEWSPGGVRLVGVLPGPGDQPALGDVTAGQGALQAEVSYPGDNAVSANGRLVFFTVTDRADAGAGHHDFDRALFVREDGSDTVVVSRSQGSDPGVEGGATFLGARREDGAIAFFAGDRPLTDSSTAQPGGADLYRWDRNAPPGQRLDDLTTEDPAGAGVLGEVGMSDDATRLYFAATGALTAGAPATGPKLYLWQQGEGVRYIAPLDRSDGNVWGSLLIFGAREGLYRDARVSHDGRFLVFVSRTPLTPDAPHGVRSVYRYDAETGDIDCASCSSSASSEPLDSALVSIPAPFPGLAPTPTPFLPRNLSADGQQIFFETAAALLPGDTDGRIDVYRWRPAGLRLISSGTSSGDSRFLDASEDGTDVYFTTRQRLTSADSDDLIDLYDARADGGFPAVAPAPAECDGDECQGPAPASTAISAPASGQTRSRRSSAHHSANEHRCRRAKAGKQRRCRGALAPHNKKVERR